MTKTIMVMVGLEGMGGFDYDTGPRDLDVPPCTPLENFSRSVHYVGLNESCEIPIDKNLMMLSQILVKLEGN
jgi:hypothetical protein